MTYPVRIAAEAEEEMYEIAARRADPVGYFAGLRSAVDDLASGMPTARPLLHEQLDDPALPEVREVFYPAGRPAVRILFLFDGGRVDIVHARWAAARPLTAAEVRNFARR